MKTFYIVADSRGVGLEELIATPKGYRALVLIKSGATLQDLLTMSKNIINNRPCEAVLILGGVCSFTTKEDGQVIFPHATADDAYDTLKNLIKSVLSSLDKFDSTPVIMCPFVGVELNRANDPKRSNIKHKKPHPQQGTLNEAAIRINEFIKTIDLERGFTAPNIDTAVHKDHGQSLGWRHSYSKLYDGVHPTAAVLSSWAKKILECLQQFMDA